MSTKAGYAATCSKTDRAGGYRAFLSIVRYFVREVVCSPQRFVRVLGRLSTSLFTQLRPLELLRIGAIARFVGSNPRFLFKHLPPHYLIRGLAAPARTACFLHHYKRLHAALPENLMRRMLEEDVPVFELGEGGRQFAITMGRSRQIDHSRHVDHEGELSLNLLVDASHVFVLSFTIAPGWVVGAPVAEVLMITRVQGALGVFEKISQAAKAMHGIPPEMLLMAALHGVAEAFAIPVMAGVSAVRHLCYDEEDEAIFKKSYDDLFARIGAVRNAADFYMAAFPLPEKPMALVKRGQKTRSRARRAFRQRVAGETFEALSGEGRAERFSSGDEVEEEASTGADAKAGAREALAGSGAERS
jgi:uncharacterized protein VirK/YbjX